MNIPFSVTVYFLDPSKPDESGWWHLSNPTPACLVSKCHALMWRSALHKGLMSRMVIFHLVARRSQKKKNVRDHSKHLSLQRETCKYGGSELLGFWRQRQKYVFECNFLFFWMPLGWHRGSRSACEARHQTALNNERQDIWFTLQQTWDTAASLGACTDTADVKLKWGYCTEMLWKL